MVTQREIEAAADRQRKVPGEQHCTTATSAEQLFELVITRNHLTDVMDATVITHRKPDGSTWVTVHSRQIDALAQLDRVAGQAGNYKGTVITEVRCGNAVSLLYQAIG